jgi:uncharacterized protein (TIGR03437 family)
MTAGEARSLRLETGGARMTSISSIRTEPPLEFPPLVRLDQNGEIRVTVPPATPRGHYRIVLSGETQNGRAIATLALTVDAVTVSPTGKTPVILMNGWQLSCPNNPDSTVAGSAGTFGQLPSLLQSDGIPVVFFNNCVYGQDVPIEALAAQLNMYVSALTYADGSPVTQVDLVAHSLGGLIARAYLSGLQADGSLNAPLSPKIRKLIELATPNFGSFQAHLFPSTQTSEMVPGSVLLWTLATWNQRLDDLRGVDALAVIGNGGTAPQSNESDGLVSLTSGSLGFARPDERTRITPYCHVTPTGLIVLFLPCSGQGIAEIDSPAHLSARIVRSFLADTPDWKSIGTPPSQDRYLSQFGGLYFAGAQTSGAPIADLTQVSFSGTALSTGGASGSVFYNEFLKGSGTLQATSTSLQALNCGSFTEPAGYYTAYRCKLGLQIYSVGPFTAGALARVVPSGRDITISGVGFGTQCSTCSVVMNPGGVELSVSARTDQAITATLPAYSGAAQIVVHGAAGSDSMTFMAAAPAGSVLVTSVVNNASAAPGAIAPGEMVAIKGSGLGPASGVLYSVNPATGMVDTTLAGTRVFFGGIAAPIVYVSATQVNAMVPYEIARQTQVTMQVSYQGNASGTTLTVAAAAPAAFTFNSTGSGQAIAANQDYSYNGPSNPAPQNSYLTIYFAGGGQTNPPGTTGGVNGTTLKYLPTTTASVGGVPATVTFSGAAPGLLDGVSQLDLQLGPNTPSGPAQPLVITINGVSSPQTATLAVQ